MLNQYSRAELLYGSDNMELLRGCRVAVFGIGGVGGSAVEALAAWGSAPWISSTMTGYASPI